MVHGIPTSVELWRRVLPLVQGARATAWKMVGSVEPIPGGRHSHSEGRPGPAAAAADELVGRY